MCNSPGDHVDVLSLDPATAAAKIGEELLLLASVDAVSVTDVAGASPPAWDVTFSRFVSSACQGHFGAGGAPPLMVANALTFGGEGATVERLGGGGNMLAGWLQLTYGTHSLNATRVPYDASGGLAAQSLFWQPASRTPLTRTLAATQLCSGGV